MASGTSENKQRPINSRVWVRIIKDADSNEVFVEQSPSTTFEDAMGLLHSAIIRYETKYKIDVELHNLESLKKLVSEIADKLAEMSNHAHLIENATIKVAAASQNILRSKGNG